MAINPIQILKDLVEDAAHTITITSVESLGSGQYKLNTDNTLYLRTLKKVIIDAVEYKVVDFNINSFITVEALSGDVPVVASSFEATTPLFVWGNPQMVSEELVKRIKNKTIVWPYIWAVEISNTQRNLNPASAVKSTPSFNLFFLDSTNEVNWTIEDHYEQDIYPLNNYLDFFTGLLKSRRDLFDTDSITYNQINHVNFGDYIVDKGNEEKILNDNVTGIQLQIDIPFTIDVCDDIVVTSKCNGASETLNGIGVSPLTDSSTKAIIVQSDASGNPQVGVIQTDTPTSLIVEVPAGGAAVVNSSQPSKTGANDLGSFLTGDDADTDRGAGVDFFTLDDNNPFGNTNKFTDTLGTQLYANDVIINWATRNQKLGLTLGLYRIPNGTNNQATHLGAQPYTFAGKSDWFVWNELEGSCFVYRGIFRDPFNYSPLNHSIAASSVNQIWSNYKDNAGGGYRWADSQFGVTGASILIMSFVVRYYTDAELGI